MAPPNDPVNSIFGVLKSTGKDDLFDLSHGKFSVKGVPLLSEVPDSVSFKSFSSICQSSDAPLPLFRRVQAMSNKGGFFGFTQAEPSDRLLNSLGRFTDRNFLSIFRFKTWWSTQWVGRSGSDLLMETQWVMLDVPELKSYVLILPIIEGKFRSALHPGSDGHVMICAESGSTLEKASSFGAIAYVHAGDNPYNLMKEAYSAVRVHLNTFRLLEEKSTPSLVDKFGWCTWDSFYLTVEPAGVWQGLKEFADGGISPRFVVIDDGWQSINIDGENPHEDAKGLVIGGPQMTARLYRLDEGEKFRRYKGGSLLGPNPPAFDTNKPKLLITKAIEIDQAEKAHQKLLTQSGNASDLSHIESKIEKLKHELKQMLGGGEQQQGSDQSSYDEENYGMKAFTRDLRTKFRGLDDIYVWHALCGAWGGVRPGATHLNSKVTSCKVSPGLDQTMEDLAVVKILEGGIGLVHPDQADDFYDSMHSYLSEVGITGVKVDVIHTLEYVSEEYGGRVELGKAYYKGLSNSLRNNFNGTGLISSMQQCNDFFLLGTEQISMGRVGDDFWLQDSTGDSMGVYWLQGVHMVHCAYNSLWMGQTILPDWDMFQSDHPCAALHAGSRAICGGPVYVSDCLGAHDFELLRKLVFPDGTIPRCQHFALPTRDCLFVNPLFDAKSILKLWNINKHGGILGAYNCQGAGWDPKEQRFRGFSECYKAVSGSIHVTDIEWDQKQTEAETDAVEYAVYLSQAGTLFLTKPESNPIPITIQPSSFEIFSFVPIQKMGDGVEFAPIGFTNMYNCGGTVQDLKYYYYNNNNCSAGSRSNGFVGKPSLSSSCNAVNIEAKGHGDLLAYSSVRPSKCYLGSTIGGAARPETEDVPFQWSAEDGKLTLNNLPWIEESGGISVVTFLF